MVLSCLLFVFIVFISLFFNIFYLNYSSVFQFRFADVSTDS